MFLYLFTLKAILVVSLIKIAYKNSSGLNGIGGTAVCMTSKNFNVTSFRDGVQARAFFEEGNLIEYGEGKTLEKNGTLITFIPDKKVFTIMEEGFTYDRICKEIKNISYLNKGIHFKITNFNTKEYIEYYSENGIADFIKDNIKKPLMSKPIVTTAKDDIDEIEVAFMWTDGPGAS
jgi:Type IIA topoisomerase (DNA gyrase/topo II, topoisomerase IV), B subunit